MISKYSCNLMIYFRRILIPQHHFISRQIYFWQIKSLHISYLRSNGRNIRLWIWVKSRQIIEEHIARKKNNNCDKRIDDNIFSTFCFILISCGSNIKPSTENQEENSSWTCHEKRQIRKFCKYFCLPSCNISFVYHCDPYLNHSKKNQCQNPIQCLSFRCFQGIFISTRNQ
jgi:hypothetical protein